jgi:hypothetical protein
MTSAPFCVFGLEKGARGEREESLDVDPARHGLGVMLEGPVQPVVDEELVEDLKSPGEAARLHRTSSTTTTFALGALHKQGSEDCSSIRLAAACARDV